MIVGAAAVAFATALYLAMMHLGVPLVATGRLPLLSPFARRAGLDAVALTYIIEHLSFALAWTVAAIACVLGARRFGAPPNDRDPWRPIILVFAATTVAILVLNAAHGPALLRGD
jgi:hypothetical protein